MGTRHVAFLVFTKKPQSSVIPRACLKFAHSAATQSKHHLRFCAPLGLTDAASAFCAPLGLKEDGAAFSAPLGLRDAASAFCAPLGLNGAESAIPVSLLLLLKIFIIVGQGRDLNFLVSNCACIDDRWC